MGFTAMPASRSNVSSVLSWNVSVMHSPGVPPHRANSRRVGDPGVGEACDKKTFTSTRFRNSYASSRVSGGLNRAPGTPAFGVAGCMKIARYAAPRRVCGVPITQRVMGQEPRCKCRVGVKKRERVPPGTAEISPHIPSGRGARETSSIRRRRSF